MGAGPRQIATASRAARPPIPPDSTSGVRIADHWRQFRATRKGHHGALVIGSRRGRRPRRARSHLLARSVTRRMSHRPFRQSQRLSSPHQLLARTVPAQHVVKALESSVLSKIPAYEYLKQESASALGAAQSTDLPTRILGYPWARASPPSSRYADASGPGRDAFARPSRFNRWTR
jgi:hypothetical protein